MPDKILARSRTYLLEIPLDAKAAAVVSHSDKLLSDSFKAAELQPVPQISSVSAYITQFKMPNTHRISFPGVSDTHVKFYFTQSFYIMRVIISPRETKHS